MKYYKAEEKMNINNLLNQMTDRTENMRNLKHKLVHFHLLNV